MADAGNRRVVAELPVAQHRVPGVVPVGPGDVLADRDRQRVLEGGPALRDQQVVVAVFLVDVRPLGPDALAAAAPQVMPLPDQAHCLDVHFLQPYLRLARKFRIGRDVIANIPGAAVIIEEQGRIYPRRTLQYIGR